MKFLIKLFAVFASMIFALVTFIKIMHGCSYRDAIGIAEELFIEIRESCCKCCMTSCDENPDEKSGKEA